MSKRTTEAYINALRYVNDNLLQLEGKGIIMDFEKAMRAAMRVVAPNLPSYGCFFHHVQALTRKMRSFSALFELIRDNEEARALFRKFQVLALLPASLIETAFKSTLQETLLKFKEFAPFVLYYKNEWIKRVKPKFYSVFKRETRTTGAAEAFNGKINNSFRTHGTFFAFVESLQKEEAMKTDEFQRDVNGTPQRDGRKLLYKKRAEMIETYSAQLSSGKINWKYFVNVMSNLNNKILYDDSEMFLTETDIESAASTLLVESSESEKGNDFDIETQSENRAQNDQFDAHADETNSKQKPKKTTKKATKRSQSKTTNHENGEDRQPAAKRMQIQETTSKSKRKSTEKTNGSNSGSSMVQIPLDRMTRNGSTVLKIQQRFDEMEKRNEIPDAQSFHCIICNERKKSVVLYPCLHQHTCEPCWFQWKVRQLNNISSYNGDSDDEATMPKCPVCRQSVAEAKAVIN